MSRGNPQWWKSASVAGQPHWLDIALALPLAVWANLAIWKSVSPQRSLELDCRHDGYDPDPSRAPTTKCQRSVDARSYRKSVGSVLRRHPPSHRARRRFLVADRSAAPARATVGKSLHRIEESLLRQGRTAGFIGDEGDFQRHRGHPRFQRCRRRPVMLGIKSADPPVGDAGVTHFSHERRPNRPCAARLRAKSLAGAHRAHLPQR